MSNAADVLRTAIDRLEMSPRETLDPRTVNPALRALLKQELALTEAGLRLPNQVALVLAAAVGRVDE